MQVCIQKIHYKLYRLMSIYKLFHTVGIAFFNVKKYKKKIVWGYGGSTFS